MSTSYDALETIKKRFEEEMISCPKCMKEVKPLVKLQLTFSGDIYVEYYCPIHQILLTKRIFKMKLPERKPQFIKGGAYIAFEGIDGCGKTYYAKWTVEELKKRNFDVIYVKEPSQDEIKKLIRRFDMDPDVEVYLFAADRIILQKQVILPALRNNKIVISDRSVYSNVAYQSVRGISEEFIWGINRSLRVPDLVILLDVPAKIAIERIKKEKRQLTRFEKLDFLEKVRMKFLRIAKDYAKLSKFVIVDNTRNIDIVKKEILEKILDFLKSKQ